MSLKLETLHFTLYNSNELNNSEAFPGYFSAIRIIFDARLFTELNLVHKYQQPQNTQKQVALALLALILKEEPNVLSIIDETSNLATSQQTIEYIETQLEKEITLSIVANHLNISIATLKRRLAAEGLSFSQIFKVKRITMLPHNYVLHKNQSQTLLLNRVLEMPHILLRLFNLFTPLLQKLFVTKLELRITH